MENNPSFLVFFFLSQILLVGPADQSGEMYPHLSQKCGCSGISVILDCQKCSETLYIEAILRKVKILCCHMIPDLPKPANCKPLYFYLTMITVVTVYVSFGGRVFTHGFKCKSQWSVYIFGKVKKHNRGALTPADMFQVKINL